MLEIFKDKIYSTVPLRDRFRRIYRRNQWGSDESSSGEGSTLDATENLRSELVSLLRNHEVESLVDIACGDFNWMKVFLEEYPVNYQGIDIVEDIIHENNAKYANKKVNFHELNIVESVPPKGDIILFRDCILHLSFDDGVRALQNVEQSGTPLVLISSYPDEKNKKDIVSGRWRRVNLMESPFNLPEPMYVIQENRPGKTLCLWKRSDLSHL